MRLAYESEGLALDAVACRKGVEAVLGEPSRGFYLVAETSELVIGQILVTPEWSDWRNAFFWWLQSVYVLREFRGRGVFRSLYQHVAGMAREQGGVRGLRLYVHRENEAAEAVYLRLGMRRLDYVLMERDLTEPTQ